MYLYTCIQVILNEYFFLYTCIQVRLNEYFYFYTGKLTLNPLGFSPQWFKPCSSHMWESRWFFPGFSGFRPPLMNDRLDISEIFTKGS